MGEISKGLDMFRSFCIEVRNFLLKPIYRLILNTLTLGLYTNELIRLGKDNDGGYVVLRRSKPYKYLLSFGIANDVSFEQDFVRQYPSCKTYCFDPSIIELPAHVEGAVFYKKGITSNAYNDYLDIFQVLCLVNEPELSDFKNNGKDIFVKMDVEGSEWDALAGRSYEFFENIDQLAIEIHFTHTGRGSKYLLPLYMIRRYFLLLKLKENFVVYNIHANNTGGVTSFKNFVIPHCIELSMLNKKSLSNYMQDANQVNNLTLPEIKQYPFLC
jgi:hypothetical protein